MSTALPRFWAGPIRYCRWAAREKPAYFWSIVIGAAGPLSLATVPPIRRAIGDHDAAPIPMTYPIPSGPRKMLTGYDDGEE
ncbi:NADH-ubiquinone oxidoreductase 9.5 kDa subunit [Phialemonium atrogriseum]|uniref:NADH-ubiquinone oxidoreductase 9.5 kDa subunit n=1 Tax=Phialemonium atrogriseum TaxID=1093897 RepID=A0AAJ0C2G1_9PEZI|nr:NADH-ubiquinone oxidoreductase 9.5 kDa subunit [Phialemonium atrogriseum]KAK1768676.1 NADH-ubiquinone oxidoreductase 9.5 kDa subunit [Phialemonium atrogriseum]